MRRAKAGVDQRACIWGGRVINVLLGEDRRWREGKAILEEEKAWLFRQ